MATCVFDTLFYTVFLVFTCSERDEASTDVSVAVCVCVRAIVILFSTLSQRVTNWKWAKNYHQIVGQLCRTLVNKQLLNTVRHAFFKPVQYGWDFYGPHKNVVDNTTTTTTEISPLL